MSLERLEEYLNCRLLRTEVKQVLEMVREYGRDEYDLGHDHGYTEGYDAGYSDGVSSRLKEAEG